MDYDEDPGQYAGPGQQQLRITTNIENLELGTVVFPATGVTLAEAVVTELAHRASRDQGYPGEIRDRVSRIREEVIREIVTPLVTEAVHGEITRTNSYGEPSGASTTLREIIVAETRRMVTQPSPSSTYNSKRTVLGQLVHDEVTAAFRTEVTAAVQQARDEVAAGIGDLVAAAVKSAIRSR